MVQLNTIKDEFDLSVDFLQGYVIDNQRLAQFDQLFVGVTGFEQFNPDKYNSDVFVIYPMETICEGTILVNKAGVAGGGECEICQNEVQYPMTSIYSSTTSYSAEDILKGKVHRCSRTLIFEVCQDCQSSLVNDIRHGIPEEYLVAGSI